MVWGATDSDGNSTKIYEHKLSPLGLHSWGGSHKGIHIMNEDESFNVHLSEEDIDDIDNIYAKWLRKEKLKKLNENG